MADDEFDDFERECFGDQDGCDVWFYGGPPKLPDVVDSPEDVARKAALREEGRRVAAERAHRERQLEELKSILHAREARES